MESPTGQTYVLQCVKCAGRIETVTMPTTQIFLCNSCFLSWKDIREKLVGHTYLDEVQQKFIKWVNEIPRRKT